MDCLDGSLTFYNNNLYKVGWFPGLVIVDKDLVSWAVCCRLCGSEFCFLSSLTIVGLFSLCNRRLEILDRGPCFRFALGPANDVAAIPVFICGLMTKQACMGFWVAA